MVHITSSISILTKASPPLADKSTHQQTFSSLSTRITYIDYENLESESTNNLQGEGSGDLEEKFGEGESELDTRMIGIEVIDTRFVNSNSLTIIFVFKSCILADVY